MTNPGIRTLLISSNHYEEYLVMQYNNIQIDIYLYHVIPSVCLLI